MWFGRPLFPAKLVCPRSTAQSICGAATQENRQFTQPILITSAEKVACRIDIFDFGYFAREKYDLPETNPGCRVTEPSSVLGHGSSGSELPILNFFHADCYRSSFQGTGSELPVLKPCEACRSGSNFQGASSELPILKPSHACRSSSSFQGTGSELPVLKPCEACRSSSNFQGTGSELPILKPCEACRCGTKFQWTGYKLQVLKASHA